MKVYDAAAIRNVAVIGHGGCGKTQLVSALLYAAGAAEPGEAVRFFNEGFQAASISMRSMVWG